MSNLDTDGAPVRSTVRLFGIDHHADGDLPWHDLTFPGSISEPVSVLVVHQTLEQLSGHSDRSINLDRIQRRYNVQFDLVVSGHHHDSKQTKWRGTPVMYTGAGEKMSKNEDATDRVAWLLTVENRTVSLERYDIP